MSDYGHIENVLAEIIVEVNGEPRIGRFERTVAKHALARLRECDMTIPAQGEPTGAMIDEAAVAICEALRHTGGGECEHDHEAALAALRAAVAVQEVGNR